MVITDLNGKKSHIVKLWKEITEYRVMETKAITRAVEKNGNEGKTMFEDKKITIEKVKDLVYALQNEFDNELDYDYKSKYKAELTETDFNIMLEFLERFIGKFELSIVEELED